jgi:transcriptional regulator of nitric oxide reductase
MKRALILLLLLLLPALAHAERSEQEMAAMIMAPMQLGTRDAGLPIWTLLDGAGAFMGYVFESRELAPFPGFSGEPINMLIAIDKTGTFLDVRVLDQSEPVFVYGLGPGPMHDFVRQYRGLSLGANIKVGGAHETGRLVSANTWVDGVAKATASVRIINETVLASALKVARERLAGIAPKPAGHPRLDVFRPMAWTELAAAGLLGHLKVTRAEAEAAFGLPPPDEGGTDAWVEIWVADLGLPMVARNLLTKEGERRVASQVENWEEPILVLSGGAFSVMGPGFVPSGIPDRIGIRQSGFPVNARDADVELELQPGLPRFAEGLVLRLDTRLGFDPASPWSLSILDKRRASPIDLDGVAQSFGLDMVPPAKLFVIPETEQAMPAWVASWTGRAGEIAALAAFLAGLALALLLSRRWVARRRLLAWGRPLALAVSLGFIGWYGQGQLSMVNLTAMVKAARGGGLGFLLYDPFTLILWGFVLVSLVVWGRGTFCGWLCPFGALQDLVGEAARLARLRQWRLSSQLHRRLSWIKYGVLVAILAAAATSDSATDMLVEIEPFKTAITLNFARSWPFVLYAVLLLAAGAVVYKAFCRYLCPLGAFLALAGRLRRWDWIARRPECGKPCRLCQVKCRYDAIRPDGAIDYAECFQCLDCVAIHQDPTRCTPLILKARRAREVAHDQA